MLCAQFYVVIQLFLFLTVFLWTVSQSACHCLYKCASSSHFFFLQNFIATCIIPSFEELGRFSFPVSRSPLNSAVINPLFVLSLHSHTEIQCFFFFSFPYVDSIGSLNSCRCELRECLDNGGVCQGSPGCLLMQLVSSGSVLFQSLVYCFHIRMGCC